MESRYFLCRPQRHNVRGICPRLALIPGLRLRGGSLSTRAHTNTHVGIYVCRGKSVSSSEPYIYIKWLDSRVKGFWLCFMRSLKTFFPLYNMHLNSLLIKHTHTHTHTHMHMALKYCRRPSLVSTAVRNV